MNRFSIIGKLIDVSELRHVGNNSTPVLTVRFKTDTTILKITFWGKKATTIDSKYRTPGECFSVVGFLDINSWEYKDNIYAELIGTAVSFLPMGTNINNLMSHVELIGEIIKSYEYGNYMLKSSRLIKGKRSASEFIPVSFDEVVGIGQKIYLIGSIQPDSSKSNKTRQSVWTSQVIKF